MSWSMFIDEPGDDQLSYPYGVLAGFAVADGQIWELIKSIKYAKAQFFAKDFFVMDEEFLDLEKVLSTKSLEQSRLALSSGLSHDEAKLSKLYQSSEINYEQVPLLLAKKKIDYCEFIIKLMHDHGARAFAMIINNKDIVMSFKSHLRKDYSYLIERFYHFLDSLEHNNIGKIIIRSDRAGCDYVDIRLLSEYFLKTNNGKFRSRLIIPEPFIGHGSMEEIMHATSILSYAISWGVRLPNMRLPRRTDLDNIVLLCNQMRFSYKTNNGNKDWSFKYINDLSSNVASGPH